MAATRRWTMAMEERPRVWMELGKCGARRGGDGRVWMDMGPGMRNYYVPLRRPLYGTLFGSWKVRVEASFAATKSYWRRTTVRNERNFAA